MKTIPRNWPRKPGDYPAMCDYCGVMWPRSKLWRDRAGNLVCPQEGLGADAVTLAMENAQGARRARDALRHRDGGNIDRDDPARPGDVLDVLGSSVVHAWWRASDRVLDSAGRVQRVRSQAPGALDAYQWVASKRPTPGTWGLTFSAIDALAGQRAHDWLVLTGRRSGTIGMVVRPPPTGEDIEVSTGDNLVIDIARASGGLTHQGTVAPVAVTYTIPTVARQVVWVIGDYQADGTKDWTMIVNGATETTSTQTDVSTAPPVAPLTLSSDGADAEFGEVVVANRVLTSDERAAIEAYWARYT